VLGVTGQDGSYLAEILLSKGYEVHGLARKSSTGNTKNIDHLLENPQIFDRHFFLERGDLADTTSLYRVVSDVRPHEVYNEADQDHVGWSYAMPGYSYDITGAAVGRILEILRQIDKTVRFFQPITSNVFGKPVEVPQHESSGLNPQSPYACAKVLALVLVRHYRETYGMFCVNGILYNHESPRRTDEYVTRKITKAAARISRGLQKDLALGDISAQIDWGYAREYMETAWAAMQQPEPGDYIIASGETKSVAEFAKAAFATVGLESDDFVRTDASLMRPSTTGRLVGDISKARAKLGFGPHVKLPELIQLMVDADLKLLGD
jgi:GDPmannose 4,6-dehydratase